MILRRNLFKHLKRHFTTMINPYKILGVEQDADIKEIKKKYFKMVNKYHPDKNKSSDSKKLFLLVKEAFEEIKSLRGLAVRQEMVD